jgi:hypothetical protein
VEDADAARVSGFPYLRVNRLLESYAAEPMDSAQFEAWLDLLQTLDESGRRMEIANLPNSERASLQTALPRIASEPLDPLGGMRDCADVLRANDFSSQSGQQVLRSAARVPDDYRTWQRIVGLYPLTSVAFHLGTQRLQRKFQATFDKELSALPVNDRLIRYAPPQMTRELVALFRPDQSGDGPKLPLVQATAALEDLFAQFAPIFEVDTVSDEDRIGALRWSSAETLEVDTAAPTVYHYLSYARFNGLLLPQLNYTIWFPERSQEGAFDLFGGHLDGITWRLTLGDDGNILAADAIHNCGCYHLFFPSQRLRLKPQPATLEETAFVPQTLPIIAPGQSLLVRVAHHTHFIERVLPVEKTADGVPYLLVDYDALRSLPLPDGGARSVFGPDGIVAGTERTERYFYWPMGVPSAGAMRQRGHHATAFVGRRHFDDPYLFEKSFEVLQ